MGLLSYCGIADFLHEAVENDLSEKSFLMLGKQLIYHTKPELYVFSKKLTPGG